MLTVKGRKCNCLIEMERRQRTTTITENVNEMRESKTKRIQKQQHENEFVDSLSY